MRASVVLACCSVILIVFAGCLEFGARPPSGGDGGTEPPTGPLLAEFAECDFRYPDNESDVPCEGGFTEIAVVQPSAPEFADGWICVFEGNFNSPIPASYTVHWNPTTEMHGIHYQVPNVNASLDGVIFRPDGQASYVWYEQETSGFMTFPELPITPPPQGVFTSGFQIYIYTHSFTSNSTEISNGTIRAHWSLYDRTAYPLQVLTAGSGDYYFHNVTVRPGEGGSETFRVQPFEIDGQDFDLSVESAFLHSRTIAFQHSRSC